MSRPKSLAMQKFKKCFQLNNSNDYNQSVQWMETNVSNELLQ